MSMITKDNQIILSCSKVHKMNITSLKKGTNEQQIKTTTSFYHALTKVTKMNIITSLKKNGTTDFPWTIC